MIAMAIASLEPRERTWLNAEVFAIIGFTVIRFTIIPAPTLQPTGAALGKNR